MTLDELILEARSGKTQEAVADMYTLGFVDEIFSLLKITAPTSAQKLEVTNMPMTRAAVQMIVANVFTTLARTDILPELLPGLLETSHPINKAVCLTRLVRTYQENHPATIGEAKEAPTGSATAAVTASSGLTPPPLPSHLVVGAPKDNGAGVGVMASPPVPAAKGYAPSVGSPPAAYPLAVGYVAPTLMPVAPPAVVVVPGGAGTAAQTHASSVATGYTWADCCQCCSCILNTQENVAVGYAQGVVLTGGVSDPVVAMSVLAAGGRSGTGTTMLGTLGTYNAQRIFWNDCCRLCNSPGCCSCSAPTWTCAAPTVGCPGVGCPAVTCDGNPCQPAVDLVGGCFGTLQACGTGAVGLITNCFGFFGTALGGCGEAVGAVVGCVTGAVGGCGEAAGAVAGCVGGAAGGCGEVLGACGGCAECCCAVVGAIGGR